MDNPSHPFAALTNMGKKAATLIIELVVCLSLLTTAGHSQAEISEHVLENGLKVIISENHEMPTVSFQIYYRAGARDDPKGQSGISHYLEHMMFKGTHTHSPLEFVRTTLRDGGITNASTFENFTVYFQKMPPGKVRASIEMEADRMVNLVIKASQAATEKDVIKEERRKRIENNPRNALDEAMSKAVYITHPYRNPVIGEMDDIDSIQSNDLYTHYKRYYSPANAFIVIAGDIKPPDMVALITKSFGPIKAGQRNNGPATKEQKQTQERETTISREAEMPYLIIGYNIPAMPHRDSYGLKVLAAILAQGKSSRLYESLVRKNQLALDIEAEYNAMITDPSLLKIRVAPFQETDMEKIKNTIYAELDRIKEEPPTERELQKAKNQIATSFTFSQDDPHTHAANIAIFELMGGWKLINTYITQINAVTAQEIQRLSQKYLTKDNRTIAILLPQHNSNKKTAK